MTAEVTICGLGPGGPGRLTEATVAALSGDAPVYLRTSRHPGAEVAAGATTFDEVYERADTFDEVYRTIADTVIDGARRHGRSVYAVPGSPLILERSVRWIREAEAASGVSVELLPAVSFLDEVWAELSVDPVEAGVRLVDGLTFERDAAGERGPLLVAHVHSQWVLSDIKLALDAGPEQTVVVLQSLGTADQRIEEVAWPDLDRAVTADHLTTLYLPEVVAPVARDLVGSAQMMHRLRQECPWDREQDHGTLRPYLVEEAYEVLDALDAVVAAEAAGPGDGPAGDLYGQLEEELGDLWFQILFHSELAAEAGWFTIADVARGLTEKMVRRHPHVYGDGPVGDEPLGPGDWDRIKQAEKQERRSVLDGIPVHLPALARAAKILKKASSAGHPADTDRLMAGLRSLLDGRREQVSDVAVGTALLAVVELGRHSGIDPESALRSILIEAGERFKAVERGESSPGVDWVLG